MIIFSWPKNSWRKYWIWEIFGCNQRYKEGQITLLQIWDLYIDLLFAQQGEIILTENAAIHGPMYTKCKLSCLNCLQSQNLFACRNCGWPGNRKRVSKKQELLKVVWNAGFVPVYKRIFKYIQIFKYFPPNIDICIRFMAIFKVKYYSNIFVRIFLNIGLWKSLEILELRSSIFDF